MQYAAHLTWTGNRGTGTSAYRQYERDYELRFAGKSTVLAGSSDPAFRGDPERFNPEEMLLGAISACHMLWYLHLCAEAAIIVTAYEDRPTASMTLRPDGGGHFTEATLRPVVTVADPTMRTDAEALHTRARERCFIANSCNFPIHHRVTVRVNGESDDPST